MLTPVSATTISQTVVCLRNSASGADATKCRERPPTSVPPPRRNRRQRKRLRAAPFATLARARRPRPSRAPPDAQLCPRAARGDAARRALRAGNFSGRGGATAVLTAVACVFSTRCPQIGRTKWRESLSMRRSMHGLSLPAPIGAAGRVRLPIAARCGFCSTVCPIRRT